MRLIGSHTFIIVFSLTILFLTSQTSSQNRLDSVQQNIYIKEIQVQGNKRTSIEVVNHFLQLDTGMVFDSLLIEKAKKRLKSTDLFLKVDIITLIKNDGLYIYVILIEGLFFNVNDIGGEYHLYKYRRPQFWWRFHMGVEDKNFRGKMEVLRTQISFWDYRSISISWKKPLFPSPYFFSVGIGAEQRPEEAQWIDHSSISSRLLLGRNFSTHSNIYLGINPFYEKLKIQHYERLLPSNDSVIKSTTNNIYEVFSSLSGTIDFRNDNFCTRSGFFLYSDIRTNALYSGSVVSFYQLTNDFNWYFPLFLKDHIIASRLLTQFRDKNTGYVHSLQYGGDGSIRGYFRGELPRKKTIKDALIFSTEYRFPIYHFPLMRVPIFANYSDVFKSLNYNLDGALILDYGRMSQSLSDLFNINSDFESATGIGFGLRVMVPTLEKSANIDLVWGEDPKSGKGELRFARNPTWHLYVDLHY